MCVYIYNFKLKVRTMAGIVILSMFVFTIVLVVLAILQGRSATQRYEAFKKEQLKAKLKAAAENSNE